MKTKRTLIVLVCLLLVFVALFAGCKKAEEAKDEPMEEKKTEKKTEEKKEEKKEEEPMEEKWELIDVHAFMNNPVTLPTDDNRMFQRIRDDFGVNILMESVPGSTAERAGIIIASGEYPHITDSQKAIFIDAGVMLPIEDYITDAANYPDLNRHYADHIKAITYSDGHIYSMNNDNVFFNNEKNESPLYFNPGWYLKWKVAQYFDYPDVANLTVDGFMDLIERYVAENPTTDDGLPYVGFNAMADTTNWRWHPLRDAPMYVSGYIPEDGFKLDEATGKFSFDRLSPVYHDYYMKLNEMYNKGLMEPNFATNSFDDWKQVNQSGTVLGFYDMSWQTYWSVNDPITNAGGGNERFFPVAVVMYEGDSNEFYRSPSRPNPLGGYSLFVDHDDTVLQIMNMFDGLAAEEWQKYIHWGIEGEDYFVNEDGLFDVTDEQMANWQNDEWRQQNTLIGFNSGLIEWEGFYDDGNGFGYNNQPLVNNRRLGEDVQAGMAAYNIKSEHQLIPNCPDGSRFYSPTWKIKSKANAQVLADTAASVVTQAIEDHQALWLAKLVMADPADFEGLWAEYAAGYDDIDIASLLAVYDAYHAEHKDD